MKGILLWNAGGLWNTGGWNHSALSDPIRGYGMRLSSNFEETA